MADTRIHALQQSIDQWIADNGGYWDEMSLLARLTEEVGELAREYNHRFLSTEGIKSTWTFFRIEVEGRL